MQLREAADALGVHYQTAYGWVRHGVLPAVKTASGYEVSEGDVRARAERRAAGTAPRPEVRVRDWAAQADRLYTAIVTGNETGARHDLDRLADGVPVTDLCELVIAPALHRIGERWASGELTIAVEHRASAICERLIAARAQQPQGRPRGVAVTATPPGERHGLPALMAAASLREDHWLVHHLAADLPTEEVTGLALGAGAGLVVLSCATTQAARLATGAARDIGRSAPSLRVLVGRPGDSLRRLQRLARADLPPAQLRLRRTARAESWTQTRSPRRTAIIASGSTPEYAVLYRTPNFNPDLPMGDMAMAISDRLSQPWAAVLFPRWRCTDRRQERRGICWSGCRRLSLRISANVSGLIRWSRSTRR